MQASVSPIAASAVRTEPRLCLRIFAGDIAAVLMPVLTVLRRRQCRLTKVSFEAGDPGASGHLMIELAPPPTHAHCVAMWVANVVGVCEVQVRRGSI